jgi:Zn-dependent protease with chaperone function
MGRVEKFLSIFSCSKTDELKNPGEYGIEIQPEIIALIEKFDPKIKIKIKDTPKIHAQAPLCDPSCIELSTGLLENKRFTTEDIMVLVAHELGHIIPKSYFECLITIIVLGTAILLPTIIMLALWLKFSLCLILGITSLLSCFSRSWFIALSHDNENSADSFAITEASIPVESFAQCFAKVEIVQRQEIALETRVEFLRRSLIKLILNTHPSIEQRILRVRTLYGTIK